MSDVQEVLLDDDMSALSRPACELRDDSPASPGWQQLAYAPRHCHALCGLAIWAVLCYEASEVSRPRITTRFTGSSRPGSWIAGRSGSPQDTRTS